HERLLILTIPERERADDRAVGPLVLDQPAEPATDRLGVLLLVGFVVPGRLEGEQGEPGLRRAKITPGPVAPLSALAPRMGPVAGAEAVGRPGAVLALVADQPVEPGLDADLGLRTAAELGDPLLLVGPGPEFICHGFRGTGQALLDLDMRDITFHGL